MKNVNEISQRRSLKFGAQDLILLFVFIAISMLVGFKSQANIAVKTLLLVAIACQLFFLKILVGMYADLQNSQLKNKITEMLYEKEYYNLDTMVETVIESFGVYGKLFYCPSAVKKMFFEEYENQKRTLFFAEILNYNKYNVSKEERDNMYKSDFDNLESYLHFKRPDKIVPTFSADGEFTGGTITKDYSDMEKKK